MRGALLRAAGARLEVVELPDPEPGPGDVLVRVEACGIGLTVVKATNEEATRRPVKLPRVPGHELVGTVVAAGPGVDRGRVGERVIAYYYLACGSCEACLAAREPLCARLRGNVGVAADGGYAELAVIPAWNALPVPDGVDAVAATVIADAVATPVHVARRAAITAGDRVAVIGAGGGLGVHMAQVARAFGADVVGLDVRQEKLDHLERDLGIAASDSSDFASLELPDRWSGEADVVVDFAGRSDGLLWGARSLGRRGRLVSLATSAELEFPVRPRELVQSELSVLGSRYASRHEVRLAAALVAEGKVEPVISRRVGIDGIVSVHDELERGTLLGRGALVWDGTVER